MLPREYRLPVRTNAKQAFSYTSPLFLAKVFLTPLPCPRFGFMVSKKVASQAVKRNRVKRQLRAVIEELLPRISGGYDILFIVRKVSLEADQETLKAHVFQFLAQKGLLV